VGGLVGKLIIENLAGRYLGIIGLFQFAAGVARTGAVQNKRKLVVEAPASR
jgi:hypothetical protein